MDFKNMKTTKLLDADTMTARLIAVNNMAHFQERFYPILAKQAGRELNGFGVLMAVQLAIRDYTEGMPPLMARMMQMEVEEFCGAIVDDEEVLNDAKESFRAVRASRRSV